MAFLRNRAFVLVYLLRAGVSVPETLCAMALICTTRFAIRPLVVRASRLGLKPLVIGGTLLAALQYPLLAEVHGLEPAPATAPPAPAPAVGWPRFDLTQLKSAEPVKLRDASMMYPARCWNTNVAACRARRGSRPAPAPPSS